MPARMLYSQAKDKRQDWHLDESNDLRFVQCCCCFCCCCCPPQLNSLFLFAISLRLALEVFSVFCRCTSTIWSSISTEIWQSRLHHSQPWSWLGRSGHIKVPATNTTQHRRRRHQTKCIARTWAWAPAWRDVMRAWNNKFTQPWWQCDDDRFPRIGGRSKLFSLKHYSRRHSSRNSSWWCLRWAMLSGTRISLIEAAS